VRDILVHLGEPTAPLRIAPARGPPLWEATGDAHDPSADPLFQSAPAFEFDQRIHLVATTVAARPRAPAGGLVPAYPRAATLASAPARKCHDQRAQPLLATANRRLTRATAPSALQLARLECLSFDGRVVVHERQLKTLDLGPHIERHNRLAHELLVPDDRPTSRRLGRFDSR